MVAGRIRPVRFGLTLMLGAAVAACGGDSTSPEENGNSNNNGGGGGGSTTVVVSMVDNSFGPSVANVKVGATVRWQNNGSVAHTTTSATALWDSGPVAAGGAFSRDFTTAGTFDFECTIHDGMTGQVVVTN